ncbi:Fructosamine kinase-domain-containing protein [Hypoxylon argillaceum]|nr:Fructosamine kinase-domain-containing protein [Hypoxylon argillaceum]
MAEFTSKPVDILDDDDDEAADVHILEGLPTGTKTFFLAPSGERFWVTTERIEDVPGDQGTGPVFKKTASGDAGYDKLRTAFNAEDQVFEFVPEYVPRPICFAHYMAHPSLYYYACEFVDMLDEIPSPVVWAEAAAKLHKRSMAKSPTRQFGFYCTTYSANIPVDCIWNASWETVWTFQLKALLDQDKDLHGLDEEYSKLQATFFDDVTPAYLGPLQSNGRSISPCLIHSNLWRHNIKPRVNSDDVCMMNSVACWGHHEAELAVCRSPKYGLGESYIEEYLKYMPKSEPAEDFDTRNAIYAMRHHVLLSLIYHEDLSFRQIAIREMKKLVEQAASTASK